MNKGRMLICYILTSERAEINIKNNKFFYEMPFPINLSKIYNEKSDFVCDYSWKGEYGRFSLISGRFYTKL